MSEALIFSPADLLLHLCQHLGQHKFAGGIRPLCDISEVTKCYADRIDWIKVASISSAWRMNGCAYLVFWLARELLDAPIPEDFLGELRPVNFNPEVIGWASEAILGYEPCPAVFPDLVKLFWKRSLSQGEMGDSTKNTFPKHRCGVRQRYFRTKENLPVLPLAHQASSDTVWSHSRPIVGWRSENKSCSKNGRETTAINEMAV